MKPSVAAVREEFDRLSAFEGGDSFEHGRHYYPRLLGHLPPRTGDVAEVGCGAGSLTALLAARARSVLAIDLSPAMLARARERCAAMPHVRFAELDADAWQPEPGSLDAIVSVATLHHLDGAAVLPRWRAALRPGGRLVLMDVLRRPGVRHLPANGAAYLISGWRRWRRSGSLLRDARLRAAWAEHERFDELLTPEEAREHAARWLPGATFRAHLFWRYSVVWESPLAGLAR